MQSFDHLYARINPRRIHFMQFIIEGYDGLAIMSTVDAGTGVVKFSFPSSARADLIEILDSLDGFIS